MSEGPSRVLVVDDDDANRAVLAAMLRRAGHDAREASDGEEALGYLRKWRPELVLLDLTMPWMDGRAFGTTLRGTPGFEDVAIIVVSGAAEIAEAAEEMGAIGYLKKPVHFDELVATVERWRRRTLRERAEKAQSEPPAP